VDVSNLTPTPDALHILLKSQEDRLRQLEQGNGKSALKSFSDNAGLVGLMLGLVLSAISLYDAFVTKPRAERIASISQFNQAVNSAAKTRQDLLQLQAQGVDPKWQTALASATTPRVLNDIATAKAVLKELREEDVGISQLLVLIYESFNMGEMSNAEELVERAVRIKNVSPYLQSEAKRYQGRYLFLADKRVEGRRAYEDSLALLGTSPLSGAQRAYIVSDWVVMEYTLGDCTVVDASLARFAESLRAPGVSMEVRRQLQGTLRGQLEMLQGQHCSMPQNLEMLAAA
jgi:hypothetical protein